MLPPLCAAPPSTTAPPTELNTTNIPVCCAGVQLNLAKPDTSIDVRVLVDGTPHTTSQVTRNGSFLYIMGLQAGTQYSLRIALTNIFGMKWVNTTVRPLLGELVWAIPCTRRALVEINDNSPPPSALSLLPPPLGHPSTPQVAFTPTAGGLTVQLTVMYPGTREDTLQYSISTSPSPLSRRRTGQQPLPVTDLTTPISGSAEVALVPGTYSVTVTVTNQHGSTTSEPQVVAVPGWCYHLQDHTLVVLTICTCGIAMLQYMHIPFACNAFYTPCMHSLTRQNVFS